MIRRDIQTCAAAPSIDEFELRAEDAYPVAFPHERLVALLHRACAAIVHPDRNAPARTLVAVGRPAVRRASRRADDDHAATAFAANLERRARRRARRVDRGDAC